MSNQEKENKPLRTHSCPFCVGGVAVERWVCGSCEEAFSTDDQPEMVRQKFVIRPLRSKEDHEAALAEIWRLRESKSHTSDGETYEILSALVDTCEREHTPIPPPVQEESISEKFLPRISCEFCNHKIYGGETIVHENCAAESIDALRTSYEKTSAELPSPPGICNLSCEWLGPFRVIMYQHSDQKQTWIIQGVDIDIVVQGNSPRLTIDRWWKVITAQLNNEIQDNVEFPLDTISSVPE